jgi:hypothetical protein
MLMIGIDTRSIERVARILSKHGVKLEKLDLYDQRFYPPRDTDRELVLRYFLVMVAMDHRLSRPGKPYEACLSDGCYHGADLLYRLGMKMFNENPGFFSPENLSRITREDVLNWLSIGEIRPPDPEIRAFLLRDLGTKLSKLYDGRVERILELSNNRLRGVNGGYGLIDLLRVFRAYADPVEKKALLFAKFIIGRGLFKPVDEMDVAVDNHLTRIAIRLGMIMISGELWDKIRRGVEVSKEEDVLIRFFVRRAYRELSRKIGIDPGVIDDHFWIMGRSICVRDKPLCDKCVFKNICLARRNTSFMVNEHTFYNTWYY